MSIDTLEMEVFNQVFKGLERLGNRKDKLTVLTLACDKLGIPVRFDYIGEDPEVLLARYEESEKARVTTHAIAEAVLGKDLAQALRDAPMGIPDYEVIDLIVGQLEADHKRLSQSTYGKEVRLGDYVEGMLNRIKNNDFDVEEVIKK